MIKNIKMLLPILFLLGTCSNPLYAGGFTTDDEGVALELSLADRPHVAARLKWIADLDRKDINAQRPDGISGLYDAYNTGNLDRATELLESGINPFLSISETSYMRTAGDTALTVALQKAPRQAVEKLLAAANKKIAHGAQVLINTTNKFGRTALHELCRSAEIDLDVLKLLLEQGADANQADVEGNTPFHAICDPGKTDPDNQLAAINLLMQYGADAKIENRRRKTPSHRAKGSNILLNADSQVALFRKDPRAQAIIAKVASAKKQAALSVLAVACSICQGPEEDRALSTLKACNHTFHNDCLDQWIRFRTDAHQTVNCPLCRGTDLSRR